MTAASKRTVLVVDDDPDISAFVQEALCDEGYEVLTGVGDAALMLAQTAQPHFILLDLMMPQMSGTEISRRLRNEPRTAHIPIVVMSAQLPQTAPPDLHCDGWLAKPFTLTQLYAIVGRWTAATARHSR